MNEQHTQKNDTTLKLILKRWSRPLLATLSYALMLALATTGLALMAFSVLFGVLLNSGFFTGFAFLTGGIIFTAAGTLIIVKISRQLESLLCDMEGQEQQIL
ncbi:MAG: hypothetical protein L3J39_13765 [Verrucomicrobiales bacterium]|nr:hypothetical protein [Verrucomicrobiales bacterium]